MRLVIYSSKNIVIEDYNDQENYRDPKTFDKNKYMGNVIKILRAFTDNDDQIVFSIYDAKENEGMDMYKLILRNTKFLTKRWIFSYPKGKNVAPKLRWFYLSTDEEIKQFIGCQLLYLCAIVPKGGKLEDMSYLLHSFETIDFTALGIDNKTGNNFFERVLPRLKNLLGEKLIIEDLR